jgi:protein gp37
MSTESKISWTDATWSPVTGCTAESPGCKNCYAKREVQQRWSKNPRSIFYGRSFGDVRCHPEKLDQIIRWKKRRRIFVCPRADLFHPEVPFEFIAAVFGAMAVSDHDLQVLTKRADRMLEFFLWLDRRVEEVDMFMSTTAYCVSRLDSELSNLQMGRAGYGDKCDFPPWPLPNVRLGVSVENQKAAGDRILQLMRSPAAFRWISAEPLLGPVDLTRVELSGGHFDALRGGEVACGGKVWELPGLDGVVAGGESGKKSRPTHPLWFRMLRDQCGAAGKPFNLKQAGEWTWEPNDAPQQVWVAADGRGARNDLDSDMMLGRSGTKWLLMGRVGIRASGRLLDGILHDERAN